MVFPGLMAMSVVRWIVGALELLQDQHLVRVTREHLQKAFACKLGNYLIRLPLQFLFFFFSFFLSVWIKTYRMAQFMNFMGSLPKCSTVLERNRRRDTLYT